MSRPRRKPDEESFITPAVLAGWEEFRAEGNVLDPRVEALLAACQAELEFWLGEAVAAPGSVLA